MVGAISSGEGECHLKYFSHSRLRISFCFSVRLVLARLRFLSRFTLQGAWNCHNTNTNACVKQYWLTRLWMLKFKTPERTQQTNDKKCSDHFCFKGSMDTTLFLLHELIFTRTHSREHSWLQNAKPSLFPSLKAFHWHSVIHTILIICRHLLAVEMRVVGISSCSRLHSTARSVMSSPWTKEWMEVPTPDPPIFPPDIPDQCKIWPP